MLFNNNIHLIFLRFLPGLFGVLGFSNRGSYNAGDEAAHESQGDFRPMFLHHLLHLLADRLLGFAFDDCPIYSPFYVFFVEIESRQHPAVRYFNTRA